MKKVRLYIILIVAIIAILFTFGLLFPKIPTFVFIVGGVFVGKLINNADKAYVKQGQEKNENA